MSKIFKHFSAFGLFLLLCLGSYSFSDLIQAIIGIVVGLFLTFCFLPSGYLIKKGSSCGGEKLLKKGEF